jgi:hypothetical protein
MLPRHPDNHLQYTADVKAIARRIKQDVTRNRKGHKLDKKSAGSLRTQLENWERDEFQVLVEFGASEAEAGRPAPKLNGAPMAPAAKG